MARITHNGMRTLLLLVPALLLAVRAGAQEPIRRAG